MPTRNRLHEHDFAGHRDGVLFWPPQVGRHVRQSTNSRSSICSSGRSELQIRGRTSFIGMHFNVGIQVYKAALSTSKLRTNRQERLVHPRLTMDAVHIA